MQTIYFEEKDAAKPTRYTSPSFFKPNATNRMGKDIRGMKGVSPLASQKFYNQTSDDLLSKYFPDREQMQKGNSNLILDAVDETKNGYVFQRTDFFSDKNRDGKINEDEELAFKLLLFVSTDGNKVKECYEVVKPADDEMILFLETDSDSLSGQKLFGRISQKIRKTYVDTSTGKLYSTFFDGDIIETVQKYLSTASKPIIEELLVTGYIADKSITADFFSGLRYLLMALSAPGKALGWVVNKLGEEFHSLKIPDEFWDTENENYSFKKENIIENLSISPDKLAILKNLFTDKSGFNLADITPKMLDDIILNQIAVIESFVGKYNSYVKTEIEDIFKTLEMSEMEKATDDIAQAIALICGVWNGLVDFVSSVLKFIGSLLEAPFDISKDVQQTLEMIDNFWDILRDGVLWKNLKYAINVGMKEMAAYLKDKPTGDINWVRVYYVGGFTISFAATFFIPVANAAKIANLGKAGEILAEIQNSLFQTAKFVKLQTAEAYQKASRALQELLEMFAKGGTQLKNFVDEIWKKIADWFVKNSKLVRKIANVTNEDDLLKLAKANRIKVLAEELQTIIKLTGGKKDLAEGILFSLKEVIEGKGVLQLVRIFGIKEVPIINSLSNYQARIWYTWRKMQIEKVISRISKLEEKAKKAFELRNEFRTATRQYMSDRKLANYLEQVEKNQEWEKLLQRTLKKDEVGGNLEKAYKKIIETSQTGRDGVDDLFKLNF